MIKDFDRDWCEANPQEAADGILALSALAESRLAGIVELVATNEDLLEQVTALRAQLAAGSEIMNAANSEITSLRFDVDDCQEKAAFWKNRARAIRATNKELIAILEKVAPTLERIAPFLSEDSIHSEIVEALSKAKGVRGG